MTVRDELVPYERIRSDIQYHARLVGEGTLSNPYEISNVRELQSINCDLSSCYKLVEPIDASETKQWNNGKGFTPIGGTMWQSEAYFDGIFDGNGYTIKNLYIDRQNRDNVGLFGAIKDGSAIQNLSIENSGIAGRHNVGSVVGLNYDGCVIDVSGDSAVIGNHIVGGCVGLNSKGVISQCEWESVVRGKESVGLLVGENTGKVSKSTGSGMSESNSGEAKIIGTDSR